MAEEELSIIRAEVERLREHLLQRDQEQNDEEEKYSAVVSSLEARIAKQHSQITSLEAECDRLKKPSADLAEQILGLNSSLEQEKAQNESLQSTLTVMQQCTCYSLTLNF